MDTTAKILERMDGTQFESFCGPVLRKMISELKNLIASGINSDGWTIKSPNDGFCFVEDNHFAMVHVTKNTYNLQAKWLYDGNAANPPKGDLIKSIAQAREMHGRNPDYKFSIFLVYNRPVPEILHIKVNETVSDDFITVRIIEQRNLVSFLDHEAEGQYLRMKLLGIDAERISRSLLMQIAAKNLASYAREIFFEESLLTKTSAQKKVEESLAQSHKTVNLLTGESGFGKSILCYGLIHSLLANDRIALLVKPSSIEIAGSLKEAVQIQLKADYSRIYIRDEDIDTLFRNTFVVIDDINKSGKASLLLEKIISWNEKKHDDSISMLCPVWPQNLNRLENAQQKKDMFALIPLEPLSFYDCKCIIEKRKDLAVLHLTDQQEHALILDTGFDPLLINLSLDFLRTENQYTESIPRVAIESYIDDQLKKIDSTYQISQFKRALNLLGEEILKNRKLDPRFLEVEEWLGRDTEELRLINLIANQRKLFFFDDEGKMYFRHDRVRDQLLATATFNLFPHLEENRSVLEDPYYAEIIGTAFAASEMKKEIAETLIFANPLAVFFSLKFIQGDSSEHKRNIAMGAILMWRKAVPVEQIPLPVTSNIAYALMGFDVKDIDAITKGFPKTPELDLAKFRNGNWLSAVLFLSFVNYFYPEAPYYWWFSILAHAKAKYRDTILKKFGPALSTQFTPQGIMHAYTFAGFLKEPSLTDSLLQSWNKFQSPANYPAYLWAIFNSVTEKDGDVIRDVLSYWSTLTQEEKSTRLLYKRPVIITVIEQISRIPWEFSEEMFSLLVLAGKDENLQEIIALLFEDIDNWHSMEIVLHVKMKREISEHRYDYAAERWNPANTHRKLGADTLNYLLHEFLNTGNNERRRYLAWRYWSYNVEREIGIAAVGNLTEKADPLFEDVLIWRIKQHDITTLTLFEELIGKKPWLIILLAIIWNGQSKLFFLTWFDSQLKNGHPEIIESALEFLQRLDNADACQILADYWEQVKFAKNAIETALFLSSPETRALADQEIKRLGFVEGLPMPEYFSRNISGSFWSSNNGLSNEKKQDLLTLAEQLSRFNIHYGIKYVGEKERLTRTKIESLLPYLTLFDEHNIYHFANECLKIGAADLCYKYFYPLLHSHLRTRIRFSAEDLKKDLIHTYKQLAAMKEAPRDLWIDDPKKYGITPQMITEVLADFSLQYNNPDAFCIVTTILQQLGTRKDILLIENFFPDFEKQSREINYLKQNVVFAIKRRSLN